MAADLDGLWPTMKAQVEAMLQDPEAKALGLWVVSAFRPIELQKQLFDAAVRKYGSVVAASKWVAPPGHSNHGPKVDNEGHEPGPYGRAVDLGVPGHTAVAGQWPGDIEARMNELCGRYGLQSPMSWEDWHYEPRTDMLDKYHARVGHVPDHLNTPTGEEMPTRVRVMDPQGADDSGRDSYWEVELATGNVENWNAARQIRSLKQIVPNVVLPLKDVLPFQNPDGSFDGILCIADDEKQDERGHWVASTYHLKPGM